MKSFAGAARTDDAKKRERINRETAYRAALESIVLLGNDGILPMKKGKIALFGAGVSHTVTGGMLSCGADCPKAVSFLRGMVNAGFEVTSSGWLTDYERRYDIAKTDWEEAVKKKTLRSKKDRFSFALPTGREVSFDDIAASRADTAAYVITREPVEARDESAGRSASLRPEEIASLSHMAVSYKKIILILNTAFQIDLSPLNGIKFAAVILLGLPGAEGGRALADLITGKVSPSGKLTATWYESPKALPAASADGGESGFYKEGIFIGYRYTNTFGIKARYPFGYGLTYTSFGLCATEITLDKTRVNMSIGVVNTGKYPGKETAQVYVSAPRGKRAKERIRLVGFAKTHTLAPTEPEILSLSFDLRDCASYCEEESAFVLEAGAYTVRLGDSSDSVFPVASLSLRERIVFPKSNPLFPPDPSSEETMPSARRIREPIVKIPVLSVRLSQAEIKAEADTVSVPALIGKSASAPGGLSGYRLAEVCTGSGSAGLIFGGKCRAGVVPGLCGKECGAALSRLSGLFPSGASLAQTWNLALCEEAGRAVSAEAAGCGISFYPVPAPVLLRSPYTQSYAKFFSEDPVVAGKTAAALVRGVQSAEESRAVLYPFGAFPEEARAHCARIKERTLREFYLKGFEICLRESSPRILAVGSSEVNGVPVAASRELCTALLRREWGFTGVLAADRSVIGKEGIRADRAMAAGVDLILAGGLRGRLSLLAGLLCKTVSKDDLRRAAARIAAASEEKPAAEKIRPDLSGQRRETK